MNDATIIWAVTISAAVAVVVYVIWSNRHDQEQRDRKYDQQQLVLDIQRNLNRQQTLLLSRCADLQRKLDDQHRILKHLRHRLS